MLLIAVSMFVGMATAFTCIYTHVCLRLLFLLAVYSDVNVSRLVVEVVGGSSGEILSIGSIDWLSVSCPAQVDFMLVNITHLLIGYLVSLKVALEFSWAS